MSEHLTDENIYYGLVRISEQIDQSSTVKFVFTSFIGDNVGVMRKAKCSTLKGTITDAFEPFHAELLNATCAQEVTDEAVIELLGSMFGQITDKAMQKDMMRIGQRTIKVSKEAVPHKAMPFNPSLGVVGI